MLFLKAVSLNTFIDLARHNLIKHMDLTNLKLGTTISTKCRKNRVINKTCRFLSSKDYVPLRIHYCDARVMLHQATHTITKIKQYSAHHTVYKYH